MVHETQELGIRVANILRNRIYLFRPERFNAGSCVFGRDAVLQPNAQNLAEVLNTLQHNRDRFIVFNTFVKEVFPQIHWITDRRCRRPRLRVFERVVLDWRRVCEILVCAVMRYHALSWSLSFL